MATATGYLVTEAGDDLIQEDGVTRFLVHLNTQPSDLTDPDLALEGGDSFLLEDSTTLLVEGYSPQAALLAGSFDDAAVFPIGISQRATGGPGFRSVFQETADGQEFRVAKWPKAERRWNLQPAITTAAELRVVLNFYRARRGSLRGFRLLDPFDHSTHHEHVGTADGSTDYRHLHLIGAGDGSTTFYQLVKRYRSIESVTGAPMVERIRPITRPAPGEVDVFLDGVKQTEGTHYTVEYAGGRIQFVTAPTEGQTIEWAGQFHAPVAFGIQIDFAMIADIVTTEHFAAPTMPLIEQSDQVSWSDHKWRGGVYSSSFNTSQQLNISQGHVQILDPTGSGLTVRLPSPYHLIPGGPIMYLYNEQSGGGNSVRVAANDQADTTVVTALAPETMVALYLRNDNVWYATS